MNYLAIDTSGKSLVIIVNKDGEISTYCDKDCGVKHSTEVMVRTEQLLLENDLKLSDLDFIASVVGAGSFTGIRIGVSTVKALCFASKKPCLSLTSFDTIAYNKPIGKVLAVINAGHDGFYVCGYQNKKVVLEPCFMMKEELIKLKPDYEFLSFESIIGLETEVVSVAEGMKLAIEDKKHLVDENLDNLVPLYVRKSQAEEGRP